MKCQIRPLWWAAAAATRRPFASASAAVSTTEAVEKKEWKPLYRRLSALGGAPEGSVEWTLNKWLREGRSVKAIDLMKYVKNLRKYRRYKHALELMDWMVKTKGMNMSYTNHAIRLDLISKVKGIGSAAEYFSCLPEPAKNQRTYGALLNCYCSERMADEAFSLYDKMKQLNLASTTLVHNNLMSLYMKLGRPEMVPAQFQAMKDHDIAPDNLTCCILMNSYASMNDIESVDRVIQEIEEGGEVTLQWSAYSTLAAIYSSFGESKKAESALRRLEELIDSRDREPFHFLISLNAGLGNLGEVYRVWNSLKTIIPKHTNMSYLTMLQALNKLDDVDGMVKCFQEWDLVHVNYDLKLTNLVIGALLAKGEVEEAKSLWGKASAKGAVFDSRTCELFMDYYMENQEMGSAVEWLEAAASIKEMGEWKLSKEKVRFFLECFEKSEDVEMAERLCASLKVLGCLDSEGYGMLLCAYAAASRTEPLLRRRIQEDWIELSAKSKRLLEIVCPRKKMSSK